MTLLALPLRVALFCLRVALWVLLPVGPWVLLAAVGSAVLPHNSDAFMVVAVIGALVSLWALMFPPRLRGRPRTLRYRLARAWLKILPKPMTHRR